MLTEIYIEALLVDEELADQVWEDLGCPADFGRSGGLGVVVYPCQCSRIRRYVEMKYVLGQRRAST